ncbi:molybdopterin-dependent oxidoreductase [Alicyclobacillus acidoterrestris]|uniref:Molybdopterin-dependent oxidoreductase n=1 Tax=Alicyclobacillus acidoterrestris (strain ATCC 49025 / DSM 3922 / CIP 106132 / NCIMB 13137 / GD3B) TaxID=1356854 RepID=T0BTW1_ALIAG|nr:molybdopterin-dependent oxidoreductase [Alicyclobacillus acidoterrestris]EPZ47513.1 hypothetical protein N007_06135 [Alicyclobacillus acidoterrestris ATCC 49025]UNO48602.1 molybdopterin-dependent oxidoreductase [Alicyclobacillus acidoterrestris]
MTIKWFKHGKWPRWLVGLHHYTIGSFILLVLTGVALYLPIVHTALIRYLPIIYDVHILLGLIFAITLIVPFLRILPAGRRIWRFDWVMPLLVGAPIVITGIMLWGVTLFPTTARSRAFTWHGWLTILLGAWILVHAFYKALGIRPKANGVAGRIDPDRRMFLRWTGAGVLGAVAVTVIDPGSLLSRLLPQQSGGVGRQTLASKGIQRFGAYYTVVSGYPKMSLADYRLQVTGDVANPMTLKWADVQAIPKYNETKDFHCVTGWSVPNVKWQGIHISQLMKLVKPREDVKYVNFYSFDGQYSESLKLSEALDSTVLLAYHMDGQPLLQEQGYPLRLVVPKMYGYKSIKWLNRVEFSAQPITGYWEHYGYPNEAYFRTGI